MTYLITQTLNGLFSAGLLFLIASGLEGFVRQIVDDTCVRYSIALVMLAFWAVFL